MIDFLLSLNPSPPSDGGEGGLLINQSLAPSDGERVRERGPDL
jgi:hypothetical protein